MALAFPDASRAIGTASGQSLALSNHISPCGLAGVLGCGPVRAFSTYPPSVVATEREELEHAVAPPLLGTDTVAPVPVGGLV
jgi:hypothetical protein